MRHLHEHRGTVRGSVGRRIATIGVVAALGVTGALTAVAGAAGATTHRSAPVARIVRPTAPTRVPPASLLANAPRPAPTGHRPPGLTLTRAASSAPRTVAPRAVVATVFTVTVLTDSPLNSPTSHNCVDAATHACSLRAAVQAANNLEKPVVIKLGAHVYQLTDTTDGTILVENPAGTTIEGMSTASTRIAVPGGDLYGAFEVQGSSNAGSSATFSDLTISGGDAPSSYGGAIYVVDYDAGAVLDNVDVTHNSAEYGGGIACYYGALWITNSSVNNNTSTEEGGGIYEYFCSGVYLQHSAINANTVAATSTSYGGGIYAEYGQVHASDTSFNGDNAGSATSSGEGGGIYDEYAGVTLVGGTVSHDTALDTGVGGGIYVTYGTVEATGTAISEDRAGGGADAEGGGIAEYYGVSVLLHGVTISHDTTSATDDYYGGGGIYVFSEEEPSLLSIDSNSTVSDNSTSAIASVSYYGGTQMDISQTTFTGNSSTLEAAGAIWLYAYEYGSNLLDLNGDTFIGNRDTAEYSGGAVMVYEYEYETTTITATNCIVKNNVASGEYSTGGIGAYTDYYYATLTVKISHSSITGNHAPYYGYGGGVSLWNYEGDSSSYLELDHDTIMSNTSGSKLSGWEGNGGGVFASDEVGVSLLDSTISGNTAIAGGTDSAEGGGLYLDTYDGAQIVGSSIVGNHADGSASEGGGIWSYPEYGALVLRNLTVQSNNAVEGGGVYVYYYNLDVSGSTFADNVAGSHAVQGQGGAIYTYDGPVSIVNSTFTGNEAMSASGPGQGGAIYNEEYNYALYYVTMSQNIARQGAAIYSTTSGSGTVRDSIIVQNVLAPKSKTETDCFGAAHYNVFISLGGNVLSNGSCVESMTPTDVITTKPGLGALASNGGLTETMSLAATSPAIDAAHGDCVATDQRGMPRPTKGVCDSGAYQLMKKVAKH